MAYRDGGAKGGVFEEFFSSNVKNITTYIANLLIPNFGRER